MPILAALLAAWWGNLNSIQSLDHVVQDNITRLTPVAAAPRDITIIDIDEASLAQLGPWPWPRNVVATLMHAIREQGVRAQIWDLVLPESQAGDAKIQEQVQPQDPTASPVVLGQILVMDPGAQNLPESGHVWPARVADLPCSQHDPVVGAIGNASSLQPAHVGHISATMGSDGIMRQLPAVICNQSHAYPQLILSALQAMYPADPWQIDDRYSFWTGQYKLKRGPSVVRLNSTGQLSIPYARPHTAWPAVSAYQLLDGSLAPNTLRHQTVLVGATALGLADTVSTPHRSTAPGVSVHAELLSAAQSDRWYVPMLANHWLAMLITLLVCFLWQVAGSNTRFATWGGISWVAFVWPWFLIVSLAWLGRVLGYPVPAVAPMLAVLVFMASQMMLRLESQRQETQRMVQHLQSFLPLELANQIAQQHPNSDSLGKPCVGTVLAVHVGGLARWSARVDSLQALGLMHGVVSAVEAASARNGGRLEHLQEQTLWVSWSLNHPIDATIATAHAIESQLATVLEGNEIERSQLSVRCAIETGAYLQGIVGIAGSRHTVLLGPVTERLHGMLMLIDELACPILLGPAAVARLQAGSYPFETHTIGQFLLPDSKQPVVLSRANWKHSA